MAHAGAYRYLARFLRAVGRGAARGAVLAITIPFLFVEDAQAVPHTVQRTDHAYDPDWLQVEQILLQKCIECHGRTSEQADFTSYERVMSAVDSADEPVVVPGRPDDSPLWHCVVWNHNAAIDCEHPDEPMMPADPAEWLTGGQLESLRRWIQNGALEYVLPEHCSIQPLLEVDYPSAKTCRACHPRQYREWSQSMHAYAQHSPVFEAFNLTLIERTSGTIGTFCSRCHTPVGTALGENGSRRNVHRSRISMEGVTCVVCHRTESGYFKANARMAIEPGGLFDTCIYGPFSDPVSEGSGGHPAAGRAHLKTSAFCGSCHDVTSPNGVRLEEAFSEWQNSPAAKNGITCQQCHMGPVPGRPVRECERPVGRAATVAGIPPEHIPVRPLSNHTFAGPDYSLLPDTEFPHKLDWMYEIDYRDSAHLTPYQQKTLRDLRISNRKQLDEAAAQRYMLLRNAARIAVRVPPSNLAGGRTAIRVDVTSTTAGHYFPTGFTAERQAWVEVTVRDPHGCVIFQSGQLDHNGDLLDEHSHEVESGVVAYDRHLLNFQNRFVALTNRGTDRTVILSVNRHLQPLNILRPPTGIAASFGRPATFRIGKASLAPLATIGTSYPVVVPETPGIYEVVVRLNFRHLPPRLLDAVGVPHLKHLLEVVVIDEWRGPLHVVSAGQYRLSSSGR